MIKNQYIGEEKIMAMTKDTNIDSVTQKLHEYKSYDCTYFLF